MVGSQHEFFFLLVVGWEGLQEADCAGQTFWCLAAAWMSTPLLLGEEQEGMTVLIFPSVFSCSSCPPSPFSL